MTVRKIRREVDTTKYDQKLAIMVTGGIDSTVLMYRYAKWNPHLISFNFGQAVWESQKALVQHHAERCGLSRIVFLDLPLFSWQKSGKNSDSLFDSHKAPVNIGSYDPNQKPWEDCFIEGRNQLMLTYARAWCSRHRIDQLIMGYEYEGYQWEQQQTPFAIMDDTTPFFVDAMNVLALSGFSHVVRIRAPFYEERMNKTDIVSEALERGIDLQETYSCLFKSADGPCGKCFNCLVRQEAIEKIMEAK